MNVAMILAGGTGSRVGADRPKQFVEIFGKPILFYTIDIFQKNPNVDAIEIVCHQDWLDYCLSMVEENGLSKVKWICRGGETFQDSVQNGINHLKERLDTEIFLEDNILIQYGAAPFTSQKIVDAVLKMTYERGSAVTGTPCYQLMSSRDSDSTSERWVDRDKYIQIACPYGFRFSYPLEIYSRANKLGYLETIEPHTTSLMFALGDVVNYTYGDQTNIKITTAEDIELFKGYVLLNEYKNNNKSL